jgi:hypothetical protein
VAPSFEELFGLLLEVIFVLNLQIGAVELEQFIGQLLDFLLHALSGVRAGVGAQHFSKALSYLCFVDQRHFLHFLLHR